MRWCDPELRRIGHDVTERWAKAAAIFGFYDYAYGQCYCVPRVYPHLMAEYLRYGRDQGVRVHYAELSPNWGEGPKPYVYLKLQWNPDLDVDELLNDWYTRCVGPEAAPLLKEYYAIWERFWTQDIQKSKWWDRTGQYVDSLDTAYMMDVREADIRKSRELLDHCVAKAGTELQRKRAELLRAAFEYYEASVLAYQPNVLARTQRIRNEADALTVVGQVSDAIQMNQRRAELTRQTRKHPVLDQNQGMDQQPRLSGELWHADLLWHLLDWAGRAPAVRSKLQSLTDFRAPAVQKNVDILLALVDGRAERVSANFSFEESGMEPWHERWEVQNGTMKPAAGTAHTGARSMLCEGTERAGVMQFVPARAGDYVAVVFALVPEGQMSAGEVGLNAQPVSGKRTLWGPTLKRKTVPGEWTPLVHPVQIPAQIDGSAIDQVFLFVYAAGFKPGERVYLDDVALYRLPGSAARGAN